MLVQTQQPASVEIETLGAWRLDGQEIAPGTRLFVLRGLAADLVMRGKARRVMPGEAAPVAEPKPTPDPTPETPPAPAVSARGKK